MASNQTFDCGDYLPGKGPDNFQDYDPPVDEVDQPVDPGFDVDPIDGGDEIPPWSKPPGECFCIPKAPTIPPPVPRYGSTTINGQPVIVGYEWTIIFEQECKYFGPGIPPPENTAVDTWKTANQDTLDTAQEVSERNIDSINSVCSDENGECCTSDECCPSIRITYFIPTDGPVTPGPSTPGPTPGPSNPGPRNPWTAGPAGPQAPGTSETIKACKCIADPVDFSNLDSYFVAGDTTNNGGQTGSYVFKRSCKKVDPDANDGISTIFNGVENLVKSRQGRVTSVGTGSDTCTKTVDQQTLQSKCSGSCADYVINVFFPGEALDSIGSVVIETEEEGPGTLGGLGIYDPSIDLDDDLVSNSFVANEITGVIIDQEDEEPPGPGTLGGLGVYDPSIDLDDDIVVVTPPGTSVATEGSFAYNPVDPGFGVTSTNAGVFDALNGTLVEEDTTDDVQVFEDIASFIGNRFEEDTPVDGSLEIDSAEKLGDLVQNSTSQQIDLNDQLLTNFFKDNEIAGILDEDIALSKTIKRKKYVNNNTLSRSIFRNKIHESIAYIANFENQLTTWDHNPVFDLTTINIISSLDSEFLKACRKIKKADGRRLSDSEIAGIIRDRLVNRTLNEINLSYIQRQAQISRPLFHNIRRSNNMVVNESAAYYYMTQKGIPLDESKLPGNSKYTIRNWKTLATDLAKYIPIVVEGETKKYYIKDTDEFIDRSTLKLSDGDYFDVNVDGGTYRLFVESEKDHAFILRAEDRSTALYLLGSDNQTEVTASSLASNNLEFDYSLSDSRENFYVLSCNLSTINTTSPQNTNIISNLVKTTTAQYDLVDISTDNGLQSFNDYIKYKVNGKTLLIDDEDRILDYLENTGNITYTQKDILFNVAKSSKDTSLFVRQLPLWLIIYPTNRFEYLNSRVTSRITKYDPSGSIVRSLSFEPSYNENFNIGDIKFIDYEYVGIGGEDVLGNYESLGRKVSITKEKQIFKTGYRQNGELKSAKEFVPSRKKSGLRVVKDIISEISNNYLLDDEGLGVGVNTFDVFSRLTLDEYNLFMLKDGANKLLPNLKDGLFENVRLYEPIKNAGTNAEKKTRLVQRKEGAPADTFVPIKYLRTGQTIEPPGTDFNSSELTRTPTRTPTR